MTNPKLDKMRADILVEIASVEEQLGALRTQKAGLAEQIRTKVAEHVELRSALSRMTPRKRKGKTEAQPEEAAVA